MTLSKFIEGKPSGIRLGQHFYNCYLSKLNPQDRLHSDLFYLEDNIKVVGIIHQVMQDYQWEELP